MYKIEKDGATMALVETPTYIKQKESGCFVLCDEGDAQGIAYNGTPYHIDGRQEMEGATTVSLSYTDGGAEITKSAEASNIVFVAMAEAGDIDTATATENAALFAEWAYPVAYVVGNIRTDPLDGNLYKVNDGQGHTSQAGWNPSLVPALWSKIGDPTAEYPDWSQPIGAQDAYAEGAKVSHNGANYTSDLDNNVWEPGVYGWTEVVEE